MLGEGELDIAALKDDVVHDTAKTKPKRDLLFELRLKQVLAYNCIVGFLVIFIQYNIIINAFIFITY